MNMLYTNCLECMCKPVCALVKRELLHTGTVAYVEGMKQTVVYTFLISFLFVFFK